MKNLYYTLAIVFGMGMIASCGDATDEATVEVAQTEEAQAAAGDSNDSDSTAVEVAEEK
jgi:hypothetical protein